MERLSGSSQDAYLADLAYHFYEAGAWEKAVAFGQRAGEQAYRLYAPQAAIEQVTRALDAVQRGSIPPSASLYRLRGQVYEMLGDFERARLDDETTFQVARAFPLPSHCHASAFIPARGRTRIRAKIGQNAPLFLKRIWETTYGRG
jgi:hypothetical protein